MLNHYSWWKWAIIVLVVIPGFFYAIPNLFGDDPGIQIRGARGLTIEASEFDQVLNSLTKEGLRPKAAVFEGNNLKLRFSDSDSQLKARDLLERELDNRYTIALTLIPAAPDWLISSGAKPMYLGLDLRGGVHFLMEVDMDSVMRRAEERYLSDVRKILRDEKIRYDGIRRVPEGSIEVQLREVGTGATAKKAIKKQLPGLDVTEIARGDTLWLSAKLIDSERSALREFAIQQNITALRNRIDELGVAEPVVQRQGDERIVVQLPGVQDTARAKRILGRTATLETMLVDEEHSLDAAIAGKVPPGSKLYRMRDGRPILLDKRLLYSGDNIVDAAASIDSQSGGAIVSISLDAVGARINQRVTGDNVGNRMAVVYIEIRSQVKTDANGNPILDSDGKVVKSRERIE